LIMPVSSENLSFNFQEAYLALFYHSFLG
jgi:hypothetical protein